MSKQRPINLNLLTIRFPITAIVSILHRASGVFLFLLVPLLIWMLSVSLSSPTDFMMLQDTLSGTFWKLLLWLILSAWVYHLLAGMRHILMDFEILSESLASGRLSAKVVSILSVIFFILIGAWLWL